MSYKNVKARALGLKYYFTRLETKLKRVNNTECKQKILTKNWKE